MNCLVLNFTPYHIVLQCRRNHSSSPFLNFLISSDFLLMSSKPSVLVFGQSFYIAHLIGLTLHIIHTGGLNTLTRPFASYLVPADGEPLVSVRTPQSSRLRILTHASKASQNSRQVLCSSTNNVRNFRALADPPLICRFPQVHWQGIPQSSCEPNRGI